MMIDGISLGTGLLLVSDGISHPLPGMIWDGLGHLGEGFSQATLLAQQVDVDLMQNVQKTWNNFVKTGQLVAMILGIVFGWVIRDILP